MNLLLKFNIIIVIYLLFFLLPENGLSQKWVPDLNEGNYKNPILYADYSDPDILRHGNDFYMVSSSFNCMPGIPVLHSRDLVNWEIINHVYDSLPLEKYNKPVHGEGSWAPSIRFHENKFYVYFCTPHDGLFMACTEDIYGKWELNTVEKVELWEDPCPFWDDDGNTYLVRSKVCANELYLHRMSKDGKKLLDNGKLIFTDMENQPVIEGPKMFKKDGYYYILAPAGGVEKGWQSVLRSKDIYGPYESKVILHQGNTDINGPHQGGMVELKSGEWWFMHFQSKEFYGRIVHLEPVIWNNDWPVTGIDITGDGIGEPVKTFKKPDIRKSYPVVIPQTSDEFNDEKIGLQWQWHANPQKKWYSFEADQGKIRLFAVKNLSQNGNLRMVPNLLLQKFPAPAFSVTTEITFNGDKNGDRAGLVIMGKTWAYLVIEKTETENILSVYKGEYTQCEDQTKQIERIELKGNICYLKVEVENTGSYNFFYSFDNNKFSPITSGFKAKEGVWIGAKVGIFCLSTSIPESKGYADFNWFRFE